MDELRLFLIVIGVAVVAGVYWWETRRRKEQRRERPGPAAGSQAPVQGGSTAMTVDPLDQARDEHAARNARALVGLEDFDIDSDADVIVRPAPEGAASPLPEEAPVVPPVEEPQGFFGDSVLLHLPLEFGFMPLEFQVGDDLPGKQRQRIPLGLRRFVRFGVHNANRSDRDAIGRND